jgi:hypothetical protein
MQKQQLEDITLAKIWRKTNVKTKGDSTFRPFRWRPVFKMISAGREK